MMARNSTDFAQSRLSPGTRLNGIYEIDQPIGIGGMGEIYKGHVIETGDPVAIKLMLPEFAENDDAFTLFRKEASALHHIQHDAIVRYSVFTIEPVLRRPYLAMEFVDGSTLTDILERDGPLAFEAVKALLRRIASGLQVAHEHGIIHRDISPDNIIIPYNDVGRAKVIDFGIARTTQHGTVISGGFAGKFGYVSPEQLGLFGGEVAAQSDIYSLALVLAQALTGRPLDMSGSQVEVVEKRRRVPGLGAIDMRIRPLLENMLQPDPAKRPASMATVLAWLDEPAAEDRRFIASPRGAQVSEPLPRGWSRKLWVATTGLALAAIVCGGGAFLFLSKQPALSPPRPLDKKLSPLEPEDKKLAPPEPKIPSLEPRSSTLDRIRGYIEQYDGGNCFFMVPVALGERAATIEGFGASDEPFRKFDSAFKAANGFEADIGVRQVTEQQCPAIAFLAKLHPKGARALHLDIDRENLRSGDVLSGIVDHYGSQNVDLVLVSDSGIVQNVSNLLKPGTDAKTFKIGIRRAESGSGRQPQLLMAIASQSPVKSLQIREPIKADYVFPRVLSEAEKSAIPISATARYFMLEN
jgi:serine/threonine protein kinase